MARDMLAEQFPLLLACGLGHHLGSQKCPASPEFQRSSLPRARLTLSSYEHRWCLLRALELLLFASFGVPSPARGLEGGALMPARVMCPGDGEPRSPGGSHAP